MTKAQRVKYALAAPVFVLATVIAQFSTTTLVSAAPVTWDGGAGDGLFSSAANWSNDTVPTNGDALIFDASDLGSQDVTVTNDISSLSVSGITLSGTASGYGNWVVQGSSLAVTGAISNTSVYNGSPRSLSLPNITLGGNVAVTGVVNFSTVNVGTNTFTLNGASNSCGATLGSLAGSGTVVVNGFGYGTAESGSSSFTGAINITSGTFVVRSAAHVNNASGITTSGSGNLVFGALANNSFAVPVTLGGSGHIVANQNTGGCSGSTPQEVYTTTLTGPITLNSDYKFSGENNLAITGTYNANGHSISVEQGSIGSITTPQGTVEPQPFTTELNGDSPNGWAEVSNKETAILNGSRGTISVEKGGILKGTGTVGVLYNYGTLNPGNSPGKMTVLESYIEQGTYQVEIQNKDLYDQLVVGAEDDTYDAVELQQGAKLDVQLYGDWDIKSGDKFTIVNNVSSDPVEGTYEGLAEGAQFVVNGVTFSISYVGGDGNDIVLTSHTTVTAPNTGVLQVVKSNPAIVAVLGIASAVAIMALALCRKSNR